MYTAVGYNIASDGYLLHGRTLKHLWDTHIMLRIPCAGLSSVSYQMAVFSTVCSTSVKPQTVHAPTHRSNILEERRRTHILEEDYERAGRKKREDKETGKKEAEGRALWTKEGTRRKRRSKEEQEVRRHRIWIYRRNRHGKETKTNKINNNEKKVQQIKEKREDEIRLRRVNEKKRSEKRRITKRQERRKKRWEDKGKRTHGDE